MKEMPKRRKKCNAAGREVMELCASLGGTISGEHGIGLEKQHYMPLIFSENDLLFMKRVQLLFDPLDLSNPGKVFPETMKTDASVTVQAV